MLHRTAQGVERVARLGVEIQIRTYHVSLLYAISSDASKFSARSGVIRSGGGPGSRCDSKKYYKAFKSPDIGLSLPRLSFGDIIKTDTHMESTTFESSRTSRQAAFISAEALLDHWMGHRRLTRKVIEAFPEDKLFAYSIGGMRPFAELAMEMVRMGAPGVRGVVVGKYQTWQEVEKSYKTPATKEELLNEWDRSCEQIKSLWPHIKPERFPQVEKAFDTWEGPIYWSILYYIDNEIHHRGQGYVYLRSLGIEPPPFWER